uniref:Uncharacterized protein n=1 Tax=Amphimedon queenslandica TaxID=400682 RepID=A0A1X7TG45_AMPQE
MLRLKKEDIDKLLTSGKTVALVELWLNTPTASRRQLLEELRKDPDKQDVADDDYNKHLSDYLHEDIQMHILILHDDVNNHLNWIRAMHRRRQDLRSCRHRYYIHQVDAKQEVALYCSLYINSTGDVTRNVPMLFSVTVVSLYFAEFNMPRCRSKKRIGYYRKKHSVERHKDHLLDEPSEISSNKVTAMKQPSTQGVRYHPFFLRWCISVMLSSPKTYNLIRESEMIVLPSQRTLRDYTNWYQQRLGYQNETFHQISEDYKISELNLAQRHVVLAFDEMKIREGLVFDNVTGNMIGYVDTGNMNNMLKSFEASVKGEDEPKQDVATHMLAVCVRGIFVKLDYPLGQFATTTISGQELYDIIWTAIRKLKEVELEVVLVVADGISTNRKFFKLHSDASCIKDGVVYKAKNIYDPTKFVWFMSDICHLIKTTRNCWENSSKNGTRHLEINGKHILWSHVIDLYNWSREESGLYIGKQLKMEHVKLTSYSRMNVRLAAQVLSKSVADLFKVHRDMIGEPQSVYKDTSETEHFCRMFNYLIFLFGASAFSLVIGWSYLCLKRKIQPR